jgi:hypothetical protein
MITNDVEDVHMKLNTGLSWQKQHSTRRTLFHQQVGQTSKMLHLQHSFL